MLPINRAIEYANALGLVPGPSGSTQMIHIGASFYYMPCADIYVRKEEKEFVIYSPDGLAKARVKKLAEARRYGHVPADPRSDDLRDITRKLYADSMTGGKVVLSLDTDDSRRWSEQRDDETGLEYDEYGVWITVHDKTTDKDYEVRTAPCGAGCRCAAQAREVTS